MASLSSESSIPALEAVQVLVSSLADESPMAREASIASLKDIAALSPLLVLDCCLASSRGVRWRFGNMAGVFQVMAYGVRALDKDKVDPLFMSRIAKIAIAEIISSKELNTDWQRAASSLLVSIGLHLPDLVFGVLCRGRKRETEKEEEKKEREGKEIKKYIYTYIIILD